MKTYLLRLCNLNFLTLVVAFSLVATAHVNAQSINQIKSMSKDETTQRLEEMMQERSSFVKEIRRVENMNRKYTKEINAVKKELAERENAFESRLKDLEKRLSNKKMTKSQEKNFKKDAYLLASDLEGQTTEILSKGGDLDPEDEHFIAELARAHYNMGNIFYERGEYQRAVVEYYQAVDLQPYDADTHYNLAFVSAEYLGDQDTALKHYQWYLYLKPDADDKDRVKQKIAQAKIHIRSKIDSPLDGEGIGSGHYNLAR